ncbi:hypothetical protein [Actinoplanes subglobosus]|uniref:STAS domain-containing protein n=1 Tax=Actinoplanes subglobosus TaxID=1547892 RepID=A0ABV8IVL4_9ACTN
MSRSHTIRYRFATVRRGDADLLVVAFSGTYDESDGDGVFMRAVLASARRAHTPAGVVLDLRDLDYRSGDMMASVLDDAVVHGVNPAVVVSDSCRKALTSLVTSELGEDPGAWLFGSVDDALRAVDAARHRRGT